LDLAFKGALRKSNKIKLFPLFFFGVKSSFEEDIVADATTCTVIVRKDLHAVEFREMDLAEGWVIVLNYPLELENGAPVGTGGLET
jgi:hypothetical protein